MFIDKVKKKPFERYTCRVIRAITIIPTPWTKTLSRRIFNHVLTSIVRIIEQHNVIVRLESVLIHTRNF